MNYISNSHDQLIDNLPPLFKRTVLEMQTNIQCPLPIIVSSGLGTISSTCQNSIDVQLPIGSKSPCSLNMLLIADSGEGKTPVDNYFTKSTLDFQEAQAKKAEQSSDEQKSKRIFWGIEREEI